MAQQQEPVPPDQFPERFFFRMPPTSLPPPNVQQPYGHHSERGAMYGQRNRRQNWQRSQQRRPNLRFPGNPVTSSYSDSPESSQQKIPVVVNGHSMSVEQEGRRSSGAAGRRFPFIFANGRRSRNESPGRPEVNGEIALEGVAADDEGGIANRNPAASHDEVALDNHPADPRNNARARGKEDPVDPHNEEDQCPICFLDIVDETRTDVCQHRFCYYCVSEWIKNKAECCLCKRPIERLFHKFRRLGNGEEIFDTVSARDIQITGRLESLRKTASARPMDIERAELNAQLRRLRRNNSDIETNFRSERLRGATFSRYGAGERNRSRNIEQLSRLTLLKENWERPRGEVVADPAFRMLVYDRNLFRMPLLPENEDNEAERRAPITTQFFEENREEQSARILPFIRRELIAMMDLGHMRAEDVEVYAERVYTLMTQYQINDPRFTTLLATEFGCPRARMDHFAQLLFEFASGRESMEFFDENSQYVSRMEYERRRGAINNLLNNPDNGNDIEVEFEVRGAPQANEQNLRSQQLRFPAFLPNMQQTLNLQHRLMSLVGNHNPFASFGIQALYNFPTRYDLFSVLRDTGLGETGPSGSGLLGRVGSATAEVYPAGRIGRRNAAVLEPLTRRREDFERMTTRSPLITSPPPSPIRRHRTPPIVDLSDSDDDLEIENIGSPADRRRSITIDDSDEPIRPHRSTRHRPHISYLRHPSPRSDRERSVAAGYGGQDHHQGEKHSSAENTGRRRKQPSERVSSARHGSVKRDRTYSQQEALFNSVFRSGFSDQNGQGIAPENRNQEDEMLRNSISTDEEIYAFQPCRINTFGSATSATKTQPMHALLAEDPLFDFQGGQNQADARNRQDSVIIDEDLYVGQQEGAEQPDSVGAEAAADTHVANDEASTSGFRGVNVYGDIDQIMEEDIVNSAVEDSAGDHSGQNIAWVEMDSVPASGSCQPKPETVEDGGPGKSGIVLTAASDNDDDDDVEILKVVPPKHLRTDWPILTLDDSDGEGGKITGTRSLPEIKHEVKKNVSAGNRSRTRLRHDNSAAAIAGSPARSEQPRSYHAARTRHPQAMRQSRQLQEKRHRSPSPGPSRGNGGKRRHGETWRFLDNNISNPLPRILRPSRKTVPELNGASGGESHKQGNRNRYAVDGNFVPRRERDLDHELEELFRTAMVSRRPKSSTQQNDHLIHRSRSRSRSPIQRDDTPRREISNPSSPSYSHESNGVSDESSGRTTPRSRHSSSGTVSGYTFSSLEPWSSTAGSDSASRSQDFGLVSQDRTDHRQGQDIDSSDRQYAKRESRIQRFTNKMDEIQDSYSKDGKVLNYEQLEANIEHIDRFSRFMHGVLDSAQEENRVAKGETGAAAADDHVTNYFDGAIDRNGEGEGGQSSGRAIPKCESGQEERLRRFYHQKH